MIVVHDIKAMWADKADGRYPIVHAEFQRPLPYMDPNDAEAVIPENCYREEFVEGKVFYGVNGLPVVIG